MGIFAEHVVVHFTEYLVVQTAKILIYCCGQTLNCNISGCTAMDVSGIS